MTKKISRNKNSGSPVKGEPEYILIGKLQRPHGVTGEIVFGLRTDFPERIKPGNIVYLGNKFSPIKITGIRDFHNDLLIMFEGINSREDASILTNLEVFTPTKDLPALKEGLYYHHQLVGLKVVDQEGGILGTIKEILITGANDVYVLAAPDGKEVLLPAVESVIMDVDLETACMKVKPPEWD